ncbi:LysR family transcriptional regulator [Pseudomonas lalucatii]|uniref:LysR family transcriptional regulator n=1 Tax=Pseudomonas lalucatii TaxID=1424203 RepID=A0ABS5Q057_9PSED|nr:LysR family transcriptional regulator [Pseudomonas lalucatii]MBS7662160.1 LysR family transcriptional regulator [Pseudomonas lalucatii]
MNEDDLRLFLRIAALGTLSAAAREAHLSPAVVSHRLAQLEKQLGVRLFHRTTRALSLSEDGRLFAGYAQTLVETMDEARAAMAAPSQQPNGTLRVSCSASFGRQHLSPALAAFLERYPTLKVDLQLSDQIVDLVQDGFDLGIRIAPGVDPGLVARKLADSSRILCAAPSYLARHGTPERPRDLARHRCLVLHEQNTWTLCHANGEKSAVHVSGPLRSNHGESLRDAALSGQGISIQSLWSIHRELADGSLVPVLADYPLDAQSSIWAVYPSGRLLAAKVRCFIDFLLERWADPPWQPHGRTPSRPRR